MFLSLLLLFPVDMYLDFACCAAVPGGGRNKEYALHLLHMCGGNIHVSIILNINVLFANTFILFNIHCSNIISKSDYQ